MGIRWGVIGPGKIAAKFAQALTEDGQDQLVAVASRDSQRGAQFARQFGANRSETDYHALVHASDIDAIYIATPHNFHYQQAKMCLAAGKHLLIEKPMCINAAQVKVLMELAAANGCFMMEALWSRFLPSCQQAMSWLQEGQIGDLQAITSTIGFAFPYPVSHRAFNPELAGGALLDLGVYSVSLSQWFSGSRVKHIQAMAEQGETPVDYLLSANLGYDNGKLAQFVTSVNTQCANQMTLHGSQGQIVIGRMFWAGEAVCLHQGDDVIKRTASHQINGFEYQIREVSRCIEAGQHQSQIMPLADTLHNLQTMDAIREQIGLRYPKELEQV